MGAAILSKSLPPEDASPLATWQASSSRVGQGSRSYMLTGGSLGVGELAVGHPYPPLSKHQAHQLAHF